MPTFPMTRWLFVICRPELLTPITHGQSVAKVTPQEAGLSSTALKQIDVLRLALFLRAVLASVALLNLVASARAQEPPKPGKEHDHLNRLVGTWDAETEVGKGTMTYQMSLGGLWLIGDFEGEFGGMMFQGKGLDTYDSATKKYRSVWVDSFSTAPRIMEGNLDKDNQVMTMIGEGPVQEGKTTKFKSITEIKDADTVNFSLFMLDKDGNEQPMIKITYKRRK